MTEKNAVPPGKRVGIALTTVLQVLVRLLLICLVAVLIGGLIYLGYITVYQQAVLPAREYANRISLLETSQVKDSLMLEQRLDAFQQRLTLLENQHVLTSESLNELVASQDKIQTELDQQTLEIQQLDEIQAELDNLRSFTDQAIASHQVLLSALEREIYVLKAASLLNRSRLYILQSNFGLARDQVVIARKLLVELQEKSTEPQKNILAAWIGRLDSALENLPNSPVAAADDLEITWELMLSGLPNHVLATPTMGSSRSATSTTIPGSALPPTATIYQTPTP